jgi:hypothetical protein
VTLKSCLSDESEFVYRYITTVYISGILHEEAVDKYSSRQGQEL